MSNTSSTARPLTAHARSIGIMKDDGYDIHVSVWASLCSDPHPRWYSPEPEGSGALGDLAVPATTRWPVGQSPAQPPERTLLRRDPAPDHPQGPQDRPANRRAAVP